MKITFLGTSGQGITEKRGLPAILVDDCILFDCGEGTLKQLKHLYISPQGIHTIFISHLHADHFLGIISLLWDLALYSDADFSQPRCSPQIFVPEGMARSLRDIIDNSFCPFDRVNFKVLIQELNAKHKGPIEILIQNRTYQIDWIPTVHQPVCYAYKIDQVLVYSADTSPFEIFIPFIHNIDTLIHEATLTDKDQSLAHIINHSTPEDVAILAKKANISQVILTHLPKMTQSEEVIFLSNAKIIFSKIFLAEDTLTIEIKNA